MNNIKQFWRFFLIAVLHLTAGGFFRASGATFDDRADYILDWVCSDWPNIGQYDGPHRIGRTGFWYVEGRLHRNTSTNAIWTILSDAIRNADGMEDANGANGGFSGWPGMDCYLRCNHLMPQWILDKYKTEYTTMPAYHQGVTANQQMMWGVACRLACETWGTELTTRYSDADYRHQGDPSAKLWLIGQLERIKNSNYIEHNANHYLWASLGPVRTLMDFTTDPELARKARHAWFYGVANAAPAWLDGHWCITYARGGWGGDQNTYDLTSFTWWLLFGGPSPYSRLDSEQSLQYTMPKFEGTLPELLHAATNRTQNYTYRSFARVQKGYYKQSYMTPGYGLYSQVEAVVAQNGDGSFDFQYPLAPGGEYQATRSGLRWDDPANGESLLAIGAPTVWAGSVAGISPYEYVLQKEDTLIGVVDIPDDYYQYVRQRFPMNHLAIIDRSQSHGRLFLHYPTVLVSVYMTCGFHEGAGSTTMSKGGFAIETASPDEYPQSTPSERLTAFYDDIMTHGGVNTNFIADTPNRFIYTNRNGHVLDQTYGEVGVVDGSPVNYESWPMMESPWVNMHQGGNLFISGAERNLVFDFQNWTEWTNNRPAVVSSAQVETNGENPVEIDLAQRLSDPETQAEELHFRVESSPDGLVELLADGHTVRFTPAVWRNTPSTFAFTAIDKGIDHRLLFHYDFEQDPPVSDKTVYDASRSGRPATVSTLGTGAAMAGMSVPALRGTPSTQSLRLVSSTLGSARISRRIYPSQLVLADDSWTFSTWFRRGGYADDDFIFYIGSGDGFSGSGDELHIHCPAQSKTLQLRHYNTSNAGDIMIMSPATIDTNTWHHTALVFERIAHKKGHVTLYLDGTVVGTAGNVTWDLKQSSPLCIGGPAASTVMSRDFNGWIDEAALFRGALSVDEIARLAEASAGHLGGLSAGGTVQIAVPAVPDPPTGLTAAGNGVGGGYTLSWTAVPDATSYTLKRSALADGPFTTLAGGLTSAGYLDSSAGTGTWFYVVSALNNTGASPDSLPAVAAPPVADPTIWASGTMSAWSHGLRLNFAGLVEGTTALTNIPLLVRLGPGMPGFSYARFASPTGADLRFTDADGATELPYEIDHWNTNGTSSVWVRVPVLTASTAICVFWGNPAANRQSASPDQLSGLQLWLKADALTGLADGDTVNTWSDASAAGRHAVRTGGAPTYRSGVLNGKPVVRFSPDGESHFAFTQMTDIRTVFWVVKESSASNYHFLLGDNDKYHFHRDLNGRLWHATHSSANVRNGTTRLMGDVVNGVTTALGSGFRLVSLVTSGNVEASTLCRDRDIAGRSWDGDIAEVIIYNRALTDEEEQRVRLYLADKYALPCSMTVYPSDYTSDGTVWADGYLGVWHLDETSGAHRDSSPMNADSELVQVTQQGTAAGIVGGADRFDGVNDYVDLPGMGWTNSVTVECWGRLDGVPTGAQHGLVSSDPWSTGIAHFRTTSALALNVALNNAGSVVASGVLSTDSWFHAAYTVAGPGASGLALYLNGSLLGTAAGVVSCNLTDVNIGREYGGRYLKGWMDEVRISSVPRSGEWLQATWRNLSDFESYAVASSVSTRLPAVPTVTINSADDVTATTATLNGALLSTGTVIDVKAFWGPSDGGTDPASWEHEASLGAKSQGPFSAALSGLTSGSSCYARFQATNSQGAAWSPAVLIFTTLPAPPSTVTADGIDGVVSLSWSSVAGATGYTLARSTVPGGPYTSVLADIRNTNALDITAQTGITYYYVVRSMKYGMESANSAQTAVTTVAAPSGLTASPGNGTVLLSWGSVAGATGYALSRALAENGPYTEVQNGITGTAWTDTGRVNGTRYWYRVHATAAGFAGAPCAAVSAVPQTAAAAPSGLAASPLDASAQLTWHSIPDATSYTLKRGTSADGPFQSVASGLLTPPRTDTGLSNGMTYYYVVSALYGTTESTNSTPVAVTPAVPPTVFVTASPGDWSAAAWSPSSPIAGLSARVIFDNSSAIVSTNDLGPFLFNTLILTNQAVLLRGDPLFFSGDSPMIRSIQNLEHTLNLPLYLDTVTTFSVPSGGTLSLNAVADGPGGIIKTGSGNLVIRNGNTYSGGTTLGGGTLTGGNDALLSLNALSFGLSDGNTAVSALTLNTASAVANSLNLRVNSSTPNSISLGSGRMLDIKGSTTLGTYTSASAATARLTVSGSGTLRLSGVGSSCRIGTASSGAGVATTLDLAGLANFEMQGLSLFEIGNGPLANTVTLADNSFLRVASIRLADNQVNNNTSILKLGSGINEIYADRISLGTSSSPYGGGRGDGTIQFNTSAGTLKLRSLNEVGAEMLLGANGTGGNGNGIFNVTGHECDIWLNRLAMGQSANSNGGQSFSFDRGTLRIDVAELAIAQAATVMIGGGINTLGLNDVDPENPDSGSFSIAGAAAGTLNLNGGTNTFFCPLLKSGAGVAALNLSGASAVLDMQGHDIGSGALPVDQFVFTDGALRDIGTVHGGLVLAGSEQRRFDQNRYAGTVAGVISGAAGLLKSGTNSLTLAAANTYGGDTTVVAGTLVVGPTARLGTGRNFAVAAGATGVLQNASGSLNSATTVRLDGVLSLPAGVTNTAACLIIGGAVQAEGLWNAARDPAHFAGGGALLVVADHIVLLDSDAYGTTSFNATGKWSNAAAPAAGNAYFTGPCTLRTPHGTASSWTFAGQSLTLDAGGMLMYKGASGYAITVDPLILNGGTLFNGAANIAWTLQGTVTMQQTSSFSFGQDNAVTVLAADLAGPGRLSTAGARPTEALTLSGNNAAWSGGLTFNGGGRLNLNSASALGSGTLIITTANGTASLDNTSSADITLSTSPPHAWNGDFTFTGTRNLNLGTNAVTLGGDRVLTIAAGILTVGGGITDGASSFGLTKAGAGTLVLAGDGSYDGPTAVTAGELHIAAPAALGSAAGATFISDGARAVLADGITVSGESLTIAGYGGNARGALQAAAGASATWNGPVILNSGDTRVGAQAGGTLTISGNIADGTTTHLLASADAATGKVILSGPANTYSGETRIGRGTLLLGRHNALPAGTTLNVHSFGVTDAAAFDLNGFNQTVAGLRRGNTAGPASVKNSSPDPATLTVANASAFTFDSPVSGNLALAKSGAGTLTLSGANTYAGATTVSAGTLAAASTGSFGTGHLVVSNNAVAALANPAGALSDDAYVYLSGSGCLDLSSGVNETVARLYIDGAPQPAGTWNAARDSTHFSGAGNLIVMVGELPPPSGLTATGRELHIDLAWNAVDGATAYRVQRATASGGPYTAIGTTAGTAFSDMDVVGGTTYYYVVSTINPLGEGVVSGEVSAAILVDLRSWLHTMTVSFPGYDRSETLTNFPALLILKPEIPEFDYAQFAVPGGGDLRFTDAGRTRFLNYEVERWDPSGESHLWVQIPALATGTVIRAYWGNPSAAAPPCRTNGVVWSNGYRGVWHLEQSAEDSSSAGHDASLHTAASTDGIVAGAAAYDGVSSESRVPHHADFDLSSNFEVQGWFRLAPGDAANYRVLTAKELPGNYNNRNWWITLRSDGLLWWKSSPGIDVISSASYADNTWHHFAAIHDGTAARLYVDGVQKAVDNSPGSASIQEAPVTLGVEDGTDRFHKGGLDDMRISGVTRSPDWVWCCWAIVTSNATFNSCGGVQSTVSSAFTNVSSGAWGSVTWQPDPPGRPPSLSSTALVFANAGTVASTNDLGIFRLNSLRFEGAAATLDGGTLVFDGTTPSLSATQPVIHNVHNTLVLDRTLRVAPESGTIVLSGGLSGAGGLVKQGAGTLVLNSAGSYSGPIAVEAGTLRPGADNTLPAGGIVLAGGTLDAGAFDNAPGTLTVTAESRIVLGAGSLSFADSSATPWTGALKLQGVLEPQSVRFGDSASALTKEQLRAIKINAMPVQIDADGYLRAITATVIIVF